MPRTTKLKEYDLLTLYQQFITDSRSGKRLQPNGNRLSDGTIANYTYTFRLLKNFSSVWKFPLRIRPVKYLQARTEIAERNYWKKFYRDFSHFLYKDCGHFDNYVGQVFKNIRVFFGYLNKEKLLQTGDFYKRFYVRKEEIDIFPLAPEELNFLITNQVFEESLDKRFREVKDFFVFGCTVALRFSDLTNLKQSNVRVINGHHYLSVKSLKTKTPSLMKLPSYAVHLLSKYKRSRTLLPKFNKVNLNLYIKQLLEKAGFTAEVRVTRERNGKTIEMRGDTRNRPRFCDVATTHTMRRTAITTMLSLGVPEQLVRKISGHSPGSKDFYRYVNWSQTFQDHVTTRIFDKLGENKITSSHS